MRWLRAAGPMVRSPAALPLGVMLGVAVVDASTGPEYNLLPVYAAGPAIAAGRGSIRNVVAMGCVAALLCLLFAAKADRFGELRMFVALVAIGYVTLAAVYAAWVRLRTERRLIDVQEVARTLEDVLFVPLPPVLGPVRIGASYVSASRATRVGGDLYKAVPSPTAYVSSSLTSRARGWAPSAARPWCWPRSARPARSTRTSRRSAAASNPPSNVPRTANGS